MKVLIYAEAARLIKISGIGCAINHQKEALTQNGIEYTTDINDGYDAVHINTYGINSRLLAKRAHREGKPVIYHAHSTKEDFMNSFSGSNAIAPLFKRWITSCYNLGDVIVTPTQYSKELITAYGIKKPIFAVSNGIDTQFYRGGQNDRAEFRERFNFSEKDKVIMSVGLYIERKGILDFVELARKMPQYKFIWFGKTPLYSIPAKIRRAVRTKLDNLIFAGFVSPDTLKKAYHGSDMFAFLTHEETEGIVLLEALASRIPVLIRDIPIYKDWLTDNENVYKARGIADAYSRIRDIVEGRLPNITEAGYATLKDKSIQAVGKELETVYKRAKVEAPIPFGVKAKPQVAFKTLL